MSRPGYDVWARTSSQLRPSLFLADDSKHNAIEEARSLAGNPDIRSVWVQSGTTIIYAAGEKEQELSDQMRSGGGFRG